MFKLDEPLEFSHLPYIFKRMIADNKNFTKTEPHPAYKCNYKQTCVWHSK